MWSQGVLFLLPGLLLLLIVVVVLTYFSFTAEGAYGSYSNWELIRWGGSICTIGLIVGMLIGYYPYSKEYHHWDHKTGTVSEISSRLLSGAIQKFAVRFEGSDQEYGCNDTRCSLISVGDYLDLSCKRVWQYSGTDGWDCNYVKSTKAR